MMAAGANDAKEERQEELDCRLFHEATWNLVRLTATARGMKSPLTGCLPRGWLVRFYRWHTPVDPVM